jgi:Flp pilus assembly pilin Flp
MLNKIRKFTRDEGGTATVEAIIILPMLAWAIVAMAVYFDAFRVRSVNLKAAYTISDMISRENPFVGPNYIGGLNTVYDFLASSNNPTWVRVSLVQFDTEDPLNDNDGVHILQWSHGTNGKPDLTQASMLLEVDSQIPVMGHGDSLVLVETHMQYMPFADIGIDPYALDNFIATRPRFTPPQWSNGH